MTDFLQSVLSTLIGVALGIPVTRYLHAKQRAWNQAAEEKDRQEVVVQALEVVRLSVEHNQFVVRHLRGSCRSRGSSARHSS